MAAREALVVEGPSRWLLLGVALAGVAAGVGGLFLLGNSETSDGGPAFMAVALVITWSFIGSGLVAWRHRPESRTGPLLVAVGFAWVLNALSSSTQPGIFITGEIISNVWVVLLFQLLLTFPDGRIRTPTERLLLLGAWVSGLALQIPWLLFQVFPDPEICDGCPANPILISDDPGLADALLTVQRLVAALAVIGLLVLLVRRWRGAPRAQRGAFAPLLWAGGITLALLVLQLVSSVAQLDRDVADSIFVLLLIPFLAVPFAFLAGLLRTHLSREVAVTRLLEGLRELPPRGGALRDLLADALGDPSLQLGYWLPAESRYVDQTGRPVDLELAAEGRFAAVVEREGRRVGVLLCDPALADQPRLVDTVGAAAALALENERLEAALRARVEELRASRARIVHAADTERRRLERDLHDGAQQRLVSLALNLRLIRNQIRTSPEGAEELLDETMADLEQATTELRELARGIHPAVLSDRGLRAAVHALASRSAVPVELGELPSERLPADVEAAAYYVIAEGLTNVARYAAAGSAMVSVARDNGQLAVEVRDDGRGGADPTRGSGLRGLADRVAALDGELEVESPMGAGTKLVARIPCG